METHSLLQRYLPAACAWASATECEILSVGAPLSAQLYADAERIGVRHPERVRLMSVTTMPLPPDPQLRKAVTSTNLISSTTMGLCLRYGIYIRFDQWGRRDLVVHELVHTAQYERLGGIEAFLSEYLHECLTAGYPLGDLEQEAMQVTEKICGLHH
jgi:hypothetical protein